MPATGAMVELQLGSTWTDVTDDVYLRDRIRITRGRQDQGSRVDPGSATITFNNKDGRFSPRNPLSPYYGLIGRNTPVRVSAVGGTPWLDEQAGAATRVRASTPDATALHVTGDLDVRCDIEPEDWFAPTQVTVMGRYNTAANRSWRVLIIQGFLELVWSPDGTTTLSNGVTLASGSLTPRMCVRITLDVDNGAGGKTVRFYAGPTLDGPWTQIGLDQTTSGTTSVAAGTAPLELGDVTSAGAPPSSFRLYGAQVRNGIGGTVVANPDFTAQNPGATAFTDTAGRAWTVTAGGLSNRRVRFLGEVSAWPARWDVSGGDVYVPVQAAGILRRLGQGASPIDSTLRRRIPSDPSVIAYWPMEDGQGATTAYSPFPGVAPMATTGLAFGSDDSLAGSAALPTVQSGARVTGTVPVSATGAWCVEFVYKIDTLPAGDANQQFLTFTTTGGVTWRVGVGATNIHVDVLASDGTNLFGIAPLPTFFSGGWSRFFVEAQQSGGTVNVTFGWITIGGANAVTTGSYSGTVGAVTAITSLIPSTLSGMSFGHVAVFNAVEPTAFNSADTGFSGESAGARYVRLCAEEGIPYRAPYSTAGTALVGPQRPDALLNLLEEAQDADVGVLYEARESIALAYRPRVSLYNQQPTLALNYTAHGEVAPPLEPVEDDTATRNDITISRPSGSSARVTLDTGALSTQAPPLGVGRYTTSESRNVQADDQLPNLASWLLHLGTWDEARYPQVTVNLAAGPWLTGAACTVDIGDLITISNPPPWLPPGDIVLMAQGYTETLGVYEWTITYNCTPGGPWTVGVLDDPVLGRADTDGSSLASAATATATSLSVAVTAGPLWVTTAANPGEFPFDAVIAGEVVTVTGITGTSSPQTWTVTRGTNGITKPLPTGSDVRLATPMILAL